METPLLWSSWFDLGRIVVVGTLAYFAIILALRLSGKRTLSKLNAFDLVVTVALGSTLATVLLSKDVALAEGILALALLIFLQFAFAWLSVRSSWFEAIIKSEPSLIMHKGNYLEKEMQRQRITREEIGAAIRASGLSSTADAVAVVLETDGTISVIKDHSPHGERNLLPSLTDDGQRAD
jgi:uncharacterized membrane protein YcaP (DUF421 family)